MALIIGTNLAGEREREGGREREYPAPFLHTGVGFSFLFLLPRRDKRLFHKLVWRSKSLAMTKTLIKTYDTQDFHIQFTWECMYDILG